MRRLKAASSVVIAGLPAVHVVGEHDDADGLIFVTNIKNYIRGEKTVMWRNFSFLYRI